MTGRVSSSMLHEASGILLGALLMAPVIPQAKADLWNEQTELTFNQPVAIPGVMLAAGTYVFQIDNSNSNRVQIFNRDDNQLVAIEKTVPAYRVNPTAHTVVTFEERAANTPEAIHDWFYPGMNYGHQFVYNR
jgi:hypothetical protein